MILILLLLCVAAAALLPHVLLRKFGYKNLTYTLAFSETEVSEGDTVTLTETICSRKPLPLPWVKAELTTDASLIFAAGTSGEVTGETRFLSSFFSLMPYRQIERRRTVTCTRRGIYEVSRAVIMLSDLFGTVELSQPYPDARASLTVLPAERGADLPEDFPQQLTGDAIRRRALMPDRFAVSGIREYADGDSARDVCWSASARSDRLMVWQYQETAAPSLTVMLNCETRPTDRDRVSDRSAYEDAIRIAAAYLCAAARAGIPVRLCANTVIGDSPAETAFCAGDAGAMRMRRLLAALPLTVSGRFSQMLTRISAEDTAATLLIVTAYTDAEMLKLAAQDPRMTVLTLRAPAGDRIPQNVRQISLAAMKG